MDAIDYMAATGDGLTWTGSGGTFQEFVDFDEGTGANRYGVVATESGALVVTGFLNMGSGLALTTFDDSNVAVVWTESLTAAGFNGLGVHLGNVSSDISIVDCFLQGNGRGYQKEIFGTKADVDATNDVITSITQGWMDLDYVTYSKEGGTDSMGLTDTNSYWVAYDAANSGWAFYSSRANAAADTSRATLSLGSAGENHSLIKTPDTRPDITVTGTNGVGLDITGTTINNFRNITLTSKATLDGCKIVGCEEITQVGGTITDCIISGATTEDGEAFIESNGSTNLISGCSFTFSNGHAVRATATGTFNFNNYFTGYGADASSDAAFFNDSGGLITLNIGAGYDSPTVLNGSGASTTIASTADLTFTPLIAGSEVRIFQAGTQTEEDGVESSGTSFTYTYNTSDTFNIDYRIILPGYRIIERYNIVLTDSDANESVAQEIDLAYRNP